MRYHSSTARNKAATPFLALRTAEAKHKEKLEAIRKGVGTQIAKKRHRAAERRIAFAQDQIAGLRVLIKHNEAKIAEHSERAAAAMANAGRHELDAAEWEEVTESS